MRLRKPHHSSARSPLSTNMRPTYSQIDSRRSVKTVSVKHNGVSMTTANLASMIAEVIRDEIIEVRRCCHFLACTVTGS